MKTALIAVHCLCLATVLALLGRYLFTSEYGLLAKVVPVACAVWAIWAGLVTWLWIKRTF